MYSCEVNRQLILKISSILVKSPFIIVKKLVKGAHVIKDHFDRMFVVSRKDLKL
jgi:hypothetical protein